MQPKQKRNVNLLCSLGYLYFILIPVLIVLLVGGIITAMVLLDIHSGIGSLGRVVILPLAIVVWLMFKGFFSAIFTKIPEPEGVEINPENAPRLYAMVQDICQKLNCPPFHSIKLYTDNNAFIAEQPTLGLLGRYRRHLLIGVPLLTFLSEQELASVIAHECGHIAGAHGRESMRIYRAQTVWERVVEELAKKGKDKYFFIGRFLYWYVPALNDLYHKQSRQFELAADQAAAFVAGPRAAADSLVKGQYWTLAVEQVFGQRILELNRTVSQPPEDFFDRMRAFVLEWFDQGKAEKLLEKIKGFRSLPGATHPSPMERIEALGAELPDAGSLRVQPDGIPYDDLSEETRRHCSRLFAGLADTQWEETYKHWQSMAARLEELSQKQGNEPLPLDEQIERAVLLGHLEGTDRGLAEVEALLQGNPDHPPLLYHRGRYLLEKGDADGAALLERAMEADEQVIPDCCEELMNHYQKSGDNDKAIHAYKIAVSFMVTNEDVDKERNTLHQSSELLPHDLPYDALMRIQKIVSAYPGITKAYVARVALQYSGQFPCYIVLYQHKYRKRTAAQVHQELMNANMMEWECWICSLNSNRMLAYQVDNVPESRII